MLAENIISTVSPLVMEIVIVSESIFNIIFPFLYYYAMRIIAIFPYFNVFVPALHRPVKFNTPPALGVTTSKADSI